MMNDRRDQLPRDPVYIMYDGRCATCHGVVRSLMRRSRSNRFRFVPLQTLAGTPVASAVFRDFGIDASTSSTIVVWKNGTLFIRAAALFAIVSELGWPWVILLLLRFVPLCVSNACYDLVARLRMRLFGAPRHPDLCPLVAPQQRALVLNALPSDLTMFPQRSGVMMSAQWRQLIIVNYAVPAETLASYLPRGTVLDDWQGEHLVSMVGFAFCTVSLQGMTLPFCGNFEEINLRFYVKRELADGSWRRGVVFVKEIVPFRLIASTANLLYGEHYVVHGMDSQSAVAGECRQTSYSWSDGNETVLMCAETYGRAEQLASGSLAEFITEHYYGYTKGRSGETTEYEVEHPPWRVWPKAQGTVAGPLGRFLPRDLAHCMREIHSVVVAEGSPVRIMRARRL
ncbi:MAG: DUF393 domain-containing protein [Phycisphaerales bacterium]|nr:DUF393 domain-containing protein [Phycisphaerales bacterium]